MSTPSAGRNPWPIVITCFFILFFSGLVSFIVFASTQHVDLVRADYYEEELRYQQQLERLNRTAQIGAQVGVTYDSANHQITVQLPSAHAHPSAGQVHLYRPSDARLDQAWPLILDPEGRQHLDATQLTHGLWKVRVEWTVAGQEYYADRALVIGPGHS